jgi:AAA domain, putative AbiEii toxin, Type IV TA system
VVEPNENARQLYEEFQDVLRLVLPPALGFQKLAVRMPEVVLVTRSGSFSLDAVSGGVAAIVDLAWQLFMFAPRETAFVVTIDEPENHLHPELQRTLLPSLLQTFPSAQFVVATHSPFIVGAVPDSNVYALTYDSDKRVVSHLLQDVDRSGSSNDILRDVLGLESTVPVWVQRYLEDVLREIDGPDVTPESLQRLRNRLAEVGLQRYWATSLVSVADRGGGK